MSATNRGGERKAYDFYATPPETIRSFLAWHLDAGRVTAEFIENRLLWRSI